MIPRLQTEEELDAYDPYAASEQDLLGIVGGAPAQVAAPAPAPAPTPFNPAGFDWSQGVQNIGGTIYQPQYVGGEYGGVEQGGGTQGTLQNVLRYQEGQTAPGQIYEMIDPTTGQVTGTNKFQKTGNAWELLSEMAADLGPILQFTPLAPFVQAINALSAAEQGNVLGALASGLPLVNQIPGLDAATATALKDAGKYVAAANAAKSGDPLQILNAISQVPGVGINVPQEVKDLGGYATTAAAVAKAVESGDPSALIRLMQPPSGAAAPSAPPATSAVPVGTAIDPNTGTPLIIYDDGSSIEYIPGRAGTPGTTSVSDIEDQIYRPGSNPLLPANIERDLFAVSEPEYGAQEAIDARTQELINEILSSAEEQPEVGTLPSWAIDPYETQAPPPAAPETQSYPVTTQREPDLAGLVDMGAPAPEPAPYFPEFEQPLLTAEPEAQRVEVSAPAPQYTPEILDFIQNIIQQEAALPKDETQRVEVSAPPPEPSPFTPIEEFKFQEANLMPETPADQRVEVTGERVPTMPEDFGYEVPTMTEAELRQLVAPTPAPPPAEQQIEVTGKKAEPQPLFPEFEQPLLTADETQRYEATGKREEPIYEQPPTPALEEPRYFTAEEGKPATVDITGKREEPIYEQPPTPALEEPRYFTVKEGEPQTIGITGKKYEPVYEQPPTPEPEPIYEQPPTPEPEPIYEQPGTPAPTPPAPPPAPRPPSPAPAPAAQSPDLSSLLNLLGRGQGAQTTYNPVLFQGPAIDLDKLFGYREPSSLDELLAMIGQKPRG